MMDQPSLLALMRQMLPDAARASGLSQPPTLLLPRTPHTLPQGPVSRVAPSSLYDGSPHYASHMPAVQFKEALPRPPPVRYL